MTETRRQQLNVTDWAFVIAIVCLAPMLWVQCTALWSLPHFQFFPMAWLGFAYFAHERLGGLASCRSWLRLLSGAGIAAICLIAAGESVFISSPWLAYASAVGLVVAWLLLRGNNLRWQPAVGLSSVLYDAAVSRWIRSEANSIPSKTVQFLYECHSRLHWHIAFARGQRSRASPKAFVRR